MADPFGNNISEKDAKIAELTDPNFNMLKLGQRVRQLRTDMDMMSNVLFVFSTASLAGGNVTSAYETANAYNLTGHAANTLNVTGVPVGAILIITEDDTAVAKVQINGGSAITCAQNKTTQLLVTAATAGTIMTVSP